MQRGWAGGGGHCEDLSGEADSLSSEKSSDTGSRFPIPGSAGQLCHLARLPIGKQISITTIGGSVSKKQKGDNKKSLSRF